MDALNKTGVGFLLMSFVFVPGFALAGDKEESPQSGLPRGTIVSGNLIRDGSWYALSGRQLAAVEKLIAVSKPAEKTPPGMTEIWPPYTNRIVLWRTSKEGLAAAEVIDFDDRLIRFYLPNRNENCHLQLKDAESLKVLRSLLGGVQRNRMRPIAHEEAIEKPKSDSNK
jgi:hypothetical protein